MGCPYGSFDAKEAQEVIAAVTRAGGGPRKRRVLRKYPRWVLIDGKRHKVYNAAEEQALLAAYRAELQQQELAIAADAPAAPALKRVRQKIRRVEQRIDEAEFNWAQLLDEEDEEIVVLLYG